MQHTYYQNTYCDQKLANSGYDGTDANLKQKLTKICSNWTIWKIFEIYSSMSDFCLRFSYFVKTWLALLIDHWGLNFIEHLRVSLFERSDWRRCVESKILYRNKKCACCISNRKKINFFWICAVISSSLRTQ